MIQSIYDNASLLSDMFIRHCWFVNNQDVLYNGHIINVKRSKVTAMYWGPNEMKPMTEKKN